MKIINNSKIFTTEQINKCIKLLGEEYQNLKDELIIYENYTYNVPIGYGLMLGNISFGNYKTTFTLSGEGIVESSEPGIISIYLDNIKACFRELDELKINFVGSLIHELRHAYQRILNPNALCNFLGKESYHEQWREKDAEEFSKEVTIKYQKEINEILGISKEGWIFDSTKPIKITCQCN